MENLGDYLKAQREKKGVRLEEIASITKIHVHSLKMLESGKWHELPPEPFLRGFITAYAKYLKLDPKSVLELYTESTQTRAVAPDPSCEPAKPQTVSSPQQAGEESESGGKNAQSQKPPALQIPSLTPNSPETQRAQDPFKKAPLGPNARLLKPVAILSQIRVMPLKRVALGILGLALFTVVIRIISVGKEAERGQAAQNMAEAPPAVTLQTPAVVDEAPVKVPLHAPHSPPLAKTAMPRLIQDIAPKGKSVAPLARPVAEPSEASNNRLPAQVASKAPASTAEEANQETHAHNVTVHSNERSWMKVVVDDEPPVESYLKKGETAQFTADHKIKVVLGHSTGAKLVHNGLEDPGRVFQGSVRYYIFPRGSRFPQDKPAKKTADTARPGSAAPGEPTSLVKPDGSQSAEPGQAAAKNSP